MSRRCLLVGFVDPDRFGQRWRHRGSLDEAFGVQGVGAVEHDRTLLADGLRVAVVDVEGGVEPDAGVAVLEVVPVEELLQCWAAWANDPKRSGNSGRYLRVRNWASVNGLSFDTWGRLWLLVTPRPASMNATGLAIIGDPRSEWMSSCPVGMFCLRIVSASNASALVWFSAVASIQPGTYREKMSMITYR